MSLHLICAGAAKGLVEAMRPQFEAATGTTISATFGAVGALREKFDAGSPCDVLVLTRAMQDELAGARHVVASTVRSLGRVPTGIAVRTGETAPAIGDGASLRVALLSASRLYFPDPQRATAGIHFMKVLRRLEIDAEVADRLSPHPSGAVAMQALADANGPGMIGCTQVTEILYTSGVTLVGVLPPGFDLATDYAAGVTARARDVALAARFLSMLAAPDTRAMRERSGFLQE